MFVKHVYLYCDGNSSGCLWPNGEEACSADGRYETIWGYKEDKKEEGWVFKPDNKAYCPKCWEKKCL